jgi:hypothetical protein
MMSDKVYALFMNFLSDPYGLSDEMEIHPKGLERENN